MTAAVTLDGVPSSDVDAVAAELKRSLEGEVEPSHEPKRFGSADRGWPAGVIALGRQSLWSHFGRQEAEVVEVCPPYRRDQLVAFLWDRLGADFRAPFIEWLRALGGHRSGRVRAGAAVTAGVLFIKEPMTAERELLRPWAADGSTMQRACAGMALGVPISLDADPTAARALAARWAGDSSNASLRHAAVIAYGGWLGARDPGSAAATHLWRLPSETPELRYPSDAALASLVVAGGFDGQARAVVLGLLAAQAEQRPAPRRTYELLPRIMQRLGRGDEMARAALAGLFEDEQRDALTTLAALMARAFDTSMGFASARAAVCALLDALAANRIDRDIAERLIHELEAAAARPGRLPALRSQLDRVLNAERRGDGSRSRAASAVHAMLHSTPEEAL
jgi:hypothetical protein